MAPRMTAQALLAHADAGTLWNAPLTTDLDYGLDDAYRDALALRALRVARGELPRGYKIGFTNRNIWQRYGVMAPIWGTVYDSTLSFCDEQGTLSLARTCQPRIEPELVFGMRARPAPNATLQQLFEALDWIAPGLEVVQSHLPDWKFRPADTVADGGLHARLLVGRSTPMEQVAADAASLDRVLAAARLRLCHGPRCVEEGRGAHVLDSPLQALHHFLQELRRCPGAPDLQAGDVVTTGTWTDAWPVAPGERWSAEFSAPLQHLSVQFT